MAESQDRIAFSSFSSSTAAAATAATTTTTGNSPPHNAIDQPLSPKDGRIVSGNPSTDAAEYHPQPSDTAPDTDNAVHSLVFVYPPNEQNISYDAGYESSYGNWEGYHHLHADGLHIMPPVIYNDNPSFVFHSGYGFNSEVPYGQYSPVATPLHSMMVDNNLYPSQQIPFPPSYYPHASPSSLQHVSSALSVSPTELVTTENASSDNLTFGPGSGYVLPFGSYGGGNLSLNSGYHPSTGILGPYEHSVGQAYMHQQQQTFFGHGSVSTSTGGVLSRSSSYQLSDFGSSSYSYPGGFSDKGQFLVDKVPKRDRNRIDSHDFSNDRNRGPRASKLKGKLNDEQDFSSHSKSNNTYSEFLVSSYNQPDFVTNYKEAKFFIIKSFTEDNVHKSIKYNVWASTPHGNRKLDASYREAQEKEDGCPVFLLFSVNGSGQFCGVAEMLGPVDFEKDADYWEMNRWNGQFEVKWHIIKDVSNIRFRHILLESNDNKPVTHSRDSQEVKLEHGIEMLKIFKDHDYCSSILDDFDYYDDRERVLKERKARQQAASKSDASNALVEKSVKQVSDSFAQSLRLEGDRKVTVDAGIANSDASVSNARDLTNQCFESFSQAMS